MGDVLDPDRLNELNMALGEAGAKRVVLTPDPYTKVVKARIFLPRVTTNGRHRILKTIIEFEARHEEIGVLPDLLQHDPTTVDEYELSSSWPEGNERVVRLLNPELFEELTVALTDAGAKKVVLAPDHDTNLILATIFVPKVTRLTRQRMLKSVVEFEARHPGVGVEPDLIPYDSTIVAEYESACA